MFISMQALAAIGFWLCFYKSEEGDEVEKSKVRLYLPNLAFYA